MKKKLKILERNRADFLKLWDSPSRPSISPNKRFLTLDDELFGERS